MGNEVTLQSEMRSAVKLVLVVLMCAVQTFKSCHPEIPQTKYYNVFPFRLEAQGLWDCFLAWPKKQEIRFFIPPTPL